MQGVPAAGRKDGAGCRADAVAVNGAVLPAGEVRRRGGAGAPGSGELCAQDQLRPAAAAL
ncbi:UNVERIFIED_CONTAM: hypothetical protein ACS92_06765 [Bacillus cereus]